MTATEARDCCDGDVRHIAIIGSGSGAFAAAIRAVEAGARVTLIERGTLGGTCVNVGCVPSKIGLRAAEIAEHQSNPGFAGLAHQPRSIDRPALTAQMRGRIDELRASKYEQILEQSAGIVRLPGHARFEDAGTLGIEHPDGAVTRLTPDRILIATGSRPAPPPIAGLKDTPWWDSTASLFTDEIPSSLAVIGSSFVACELAQMYQRLGTAVTLIARGRLLSREDPEVGEALASALTAEGMRLQTHTTPQRVEHDGDGFRLDLGGETLRSDRLVVAAGRRPNTDDLGLDRAGIATDANGAVRIDSGMGTNVDGVYAAGDCTTLPRLVYVAAASGTRAATNMTGGQAELDLSILPKVLFTDPQVAMVGMDEEQARAGGIQPISRRLDLDQVPRALVNFDTRGFVRLIAEAGTERLIGARIVAPQAGEIIHTAGLAIRTRLTVADLAGELFAYLTVAEALKLCAQTFHRDVSQLSCCAG